MNVAYQRHVKERAAQGLPPLPLSAEQTAEVCRHLSNPEIDDRGRAGLTGADLAELLAERVPPGVAPAAKVKADFLADVAVEKVRSPFLKPGRAVELLRTMLGGDNVPPLVRFLDDLTLGPLAAAALKRTILVFDRFAAIQALAERGNRFARQVLESWAEAEWFTARPELPEAIPVTIFKVDGEVNTDDLSPAKHASTRPDIPLHALSLGETRFPGGIEKMRLQSSEGLVGMDDQSVPVENGHGVRQHV